MDFDIVFEDIIEFFMEYYRFGWFLDELDKIIVDFWFVLDFDVSKFGEYDIIIFILGWWS